MAGIILQYISILLLCHRLVLTSAATHQSPCYPSGSIACKVYNHKRLDCAYRNLVCIPLLPSNASLQVIELHSNQLNVIPDDAFNGLYNLLNLDLSVNNISYIYDNSFKGLHQLLLLDLSQNKLKNLTGTSFRDLVSLQTLHLQDNVITSLTSLTLAALTNLEQLNINFGSFNNVSNTPFINLTSLQSLSLETPWTVSDCSATSELFTGLSKLENLDLVYGGCINLDFCPLISLQTLTVTGYPGLIINITNECFTEMPLKHIEANSFELYSLYVYLHHLTSLYIETSTDVNEIITNLKSLNSPLRILSLESFDDVNLLNSTMFDTVIVNLNSTTFEGLAKWNATLNTLTIFVAELWIEGSPFKWFPNLHVLRIIGNGDYPQPVKMFSANAFDGLENLRELRLTYLHFNVFASGALHIFGAYNSLKFLDLANNEIQDDITYDQLCVITSLEELVLSNNNIYSLPHSFPCNPFLNTLLANKALAASHSSSIDLVEICHNAPNLDILDASSLFIYFGSCTCPKLMNIYLNEILPYDIASAEVIVPNLQRLYLANVKGSQYPQNMIKVVLNAFKSHNLQFLDLHSNAISAIDKEDAMLLNNLIWLDLSNNQLVSLSNLQNLNHMQTLLLSGNKISVVPESLLSQSNHPELQTLELQNNPLLCDCSVMALRKWLLTDQVVSLYYDTPIEHDDYYICHSPDSKYGLSVTEINLDCKPKLWMYISIGIACLVVVVITTIIVVRYRWHIQYIRFLLFNRRPYQNYLINNDDDVLGDDEDENGVPRYDAYVIYHGQDEDWVDGELLANIEEGEEPFRLCLKTRDIRAGRLIFNELSLHIQRSRKVIAILSPHFVNDNWCHFELNMAHHRVLAENPNVLIFVLLEDLPQRRLTLLLRQLFCRVQCFRWPADGHGQYLFWRSLKEELKRPVPLDRRIQV
ncbi:toll-like receptor 2 [Amphiura filiformis]|uniref:toll-like receptor 2 n=1 Tax=Amphiura filiformis TaxID=82378 RepID=UPI003B20E32B